MLFGFPRPSVDKLCEAVRTGDEATVMLLLERRCNPNRRGKRHGWAPLHYAAARNDRAMAVHLLNHGADPAYRNADGDSPLHVAAESNAGGVVAVLMESLPDVDIQGSGRGTPLHRAAAMGNVAAIEALLNRGAKVNLADELGRTPLYFAVGYSPPKIAAARVLLDRGANPDAPPVSGMRLRDLALRQNSEELCDLFRTAHRK